MNKARVLVNDVPAGELEKLSKHHYQFTYYPDYQGPPVSLTMPLQISPYTFETFPPFFEGLLPEGVLLDALLRRYKIDREDYFSQLIKVGADVVGAVTIEEIT